MIKSYINAFIILTIIISICFLFTVSSFANYGDIFFYNEDGIKQLTESEYSPGQPQINNSGEVVWSASDGPERFWDYGIFYYNDTTTTRLTSGNFSLSSPQINDVGFMVWVGRPKSRYSDFYGDTNEIYYYDGAINKYGGPNIIQLTDDGLDDDYHPQISNSGEVVWYRFDGHDNEIYYYDGAINKYGGPNIIQLTDNDYDDDSPQINDSGEVVWIRHDGGIFYGYYDRITYEIFYYDGANIIQLTDNDYYDGYPQINDSGEVVWSGFDGYDNEIFYYDGANIIQLTDNDYNDDCPQINDSGEIFWIGNPTQGSTQIYFYDGMDIIQLTDNLTYKDSLQINNSGEAVWRTHKASGYEIFYYDGIDIVQLTDNDYDEIGPRINDSGDIVWYTSVITDPGTWYYSDSDNGFKQPFWSIRRIEQPKTWTWSSGGYGGGCLISTAAYGFRMPKKSLALVLIFGCLLISFAVSRRKLRYDHF